MLSSAFPVCFEILAKILIFLLALLGSVPDCRCSTVRLLVALDCRRVP